MTTWHVAATKRRYGGNARRYRRVVWLARETRDALRIARALMEHGWRITRVWQKDTFELA